MAAPLKDSFGLDVPTGIAREIAAAWPPFRVDAFLADVSPGYDDLELIARVRRIARALHAHLPADYDEAVGILMASLGPPVSATLTGMASFFYAPHVFFVAEFGIDHWATSMRAQYELTQRFTAEFSIRAFLEREPERTLARLREWAADPSEDVRRLVSEGTRPRLPWAPRLRTFQRDPAPVIELLELLKDDPSAYVRRSVANNLNDIGKDHPELLVEVCRRWLDGATDGRRWVVRHGLRSAIKRGDRAALALLGFDAGGVADVVAAQIEPAAPRIGDGVRVSATIGNAGDRRAAFNVDLRIHFVKSNGRTSPKVFKVRRVELEPGERVALSKRISLQQHTTRVHRSGEHRVELLINGELRPAGSFLLRDAPQDRRP